GRESLGQVLLHDPHPLEVGGRVEAQPARRTLRAQQPVATLPRPQQLGAHARALAELADPQELSRRHRAYLYISWTTPRQVCYGAPWLYKFYTGGVQHERAQFAGRRSGDRRGSQLGARRDRGVRSGGLDLR